VGSYSPTELAYELFTLGKPSAGRAAERRNTCVLGARGTRCGPSNG